MRLVLALLALALAAAEDQSTALRLAAPGRAERTAAERAALPCLLDPELLRPLLIELASAPPEARLRLSSLAAARPASAAALAVLAAEGEPVAAAARELLIEVIAAAVARTAPVDATAERWSREPPLRSGVISGIALPLGAAVPLEIALAMLQETVAGRAPVVLDPVLCGGGAAVPPVEPAEFLPTTASGLVKRWLARRGLDAADLGIVRLVLPLAEARELERRVRVEDAGHGPPLRERSIAEFLVGRVLAPGAEPWARGELFLALHLPGAADAAASRARLGDPAGWSALASSRVPPDLALAALASGAPPLSRFRALIELARRPELAAAVAARGFAARDADLGAAAAFAAGRARRGEFEGELSVRLGSSSAAERTAAALALAELRPREPAVAAAVGAALALGVPAPRLSAALAALCALDAANAGAIDVEPLLSCEDGAVRCLGAALLGRRGAAPPPALRSSAVAAAAWAATFSSTAVGSARLWHGAPPIGSLLALDLAGRSAPFAAGLAAAALGRELAADRSGSSSTEIARIAALRADDFLFFALLAPTGAELAADVDRRLNRLRLGMRELKADPRAAAALAELTEVLGEDERGASQRLIDPRQFP